MELDDEKIWNKLEIQNPPSYWILLLIPPKLEGLKEILLNDVCLKREGIKMHA